MGRARRRVQIAACTRVNAGMTYSMKQLYEPACTSCTVLCQSSVYSYRVPWEREVAFYDVLAMLHAVHQLTNPSAVYALPLNIYSPFQEGWSLFVAT
eukprot:4051198-Prymnesium_polylepis.1